MKRVGTDRQTGRGRKSFFLSLCYSKAVNQRAGVQSERSICYVSCSVLFWYCYSYCLDSDSRNLFLAEQTDKNKLFTRGRLLFLIHRTFNAQCGTFDNRFSYTAYQGDSEFVLGGHTRCLLTHLPNAGKVPEIKIPSLFFPITLLYVIQISLNLLYRPIQEQRKW